VFLCSAWRADSIGSARLIYLDEDEEEEDPEERELELPPELLEPPDDEEPPELEEPEPELDPEPELELLPEEEEEPLEEEELLDEPEEEDEPEDEERRAELDSPEEEEENSEPEPEELEELELDSPPAQASSEGSLPQLWGPMRASSSMARWRSSTARSEVSSALRSVGDGPLSWADSGSWPNTWLMCFISCSRSGVMDGLMMTAFCRPPGASTPETEPEAAESDTEKVSELLMVERLPLLPSEWCPWWLWWPPP